MKNIGIIIQGPISHITKPYLKKNVSYLDEFFPNYDIVISTQTKDEELLNWCREELRVRVMECSTIESTVFEVLNRNNFGNQTITSKIGLNALENASDEKYDYIIKVRADEFFEDYEPLIKKMEENPDKLICGNYFFRKDFPYHIGDHLIAGTLENFKLFVESSFNRLYDSCSNFMLFEDSILNDDYSTYIYNGENIRTMIEINETFVPPECRLTINYLLEKGEIPLCKRHKELMNKYFDVIDVRTMGDFECRSNYWRMVINKDNYENFEYEIFNKKENQCWDCPTFIMCKERQRQAMMFSLINGSITDMSELYDLNNDIDIFSSVYRPWTKIDQFKKCITIT